MDAPTVQHRGYEIHYSENQDVWRCYDLDYEHARLGKVKEKIDAIEREHRKMARQAIYISNDGQAKEVVIVSIDEDRDRCFITTDQQGTDRWGRPIEGKLKRERVDLKNLCDPTPENRVLIAAMAQKREAYLAAMKAATAAREAIPRLTRSDLISQGVPTTVFN